MVTKIKIGQSATKCLRIIDKGSTTILIGVHSSEWKRVGVYINIRYSLILYESIRNKLFAED